MVLYIGNLSPLVTASDLCDLARMPAGAHLRIIKKKTRDGGLVRFALVQTSGPRQAQRIIARLDGKPCQGQRLVAREYEPRAAGNERRRLDWRQLDWTRAERRRDERRTLQTQPELALHSSAA